MTDRIKNHERDIAPARAQNSAISEHDIETGHVAVKDQVRFIDHDFPWHTGRVKEAYHIRIYPYKKSRDNGIEIPKHGCELSKTMTANQRQNPTMRDKRLIDGMTLMIEMHQWERAVTQR